MLSKLLTSSCTMYSVPFAIFLVRKRCRFVGRAAGGDDKVGRGGEELAHELKADSAVGAKVGRG